MTITNLSIMTQRRRLRDKTTEFLSTGKVAELCDVSRDTVLKWIKAGKLQSFQTPGGHYRTPRAALNNLLQARIESQDSEPDGKSHLYCWEYYANDGPIKDECKACLVYRSKSRRCYELAKLPAESGHSRLYCEMSCADCEYYWQVHGQKSNVIVVTTDDRRCTRLNEKSPAMKFNLKIAANEYDCSLLINEFRPDFVVIDRSLTIQRRNDLINNLHKDPRLPLVRVVLDSDPAKLSKSLRRKVFAFVKGGATLGSIAKLMGEFEIERSEVERRTLLPNLTY